jgi:hypothetical protein
MVGGLHWSSCRCILTRYSISEARPLKKICLSLSGPFQPHMSGNGCFGSGWYHEHVSCGDTNTLVWLALADIMTIRAAFTAWCRRQLKALPAASRRPAHASTTYVNQCRRRVMGCTAHTHTQQQLRGHTTIALGCIMEQWWSTTVYRYRTKCASVCATMHVFETRNTELNPCLERTRLTWW